MQRVQVVENASVPRLGALECERSDKVDVLVYTLPGKDTKSKEKESNDRMTKRANMGAERRELLGRAPVWRRSKRDQSRAAASPRENAHGNRESECNKNTENRENITSI